MSRAAILLLSILASCADPGASQRNEAAELADNAATAPAAAISPSKSGEAPSSSARTDMPSEAAVPEAVRKAGTGDNGCGAGRYRHLLGQHRSRIPAKPAGETWRVTCTSCPMTMDYSERRLNILYQDRTGLVEEVRCG